MAAALLGASLAAAEPVTGPTTEPVTESTPDSRRSGFDFMTPATQALQRDDTQNPAMLWREGGAQRFAAECRRCHTPGALRGAAARHPAFDTRLGRPVTLGQRIDLCRSRYLGQAGDGPEGEARLELETYVAHLSRGMPVAPPADPRLAAGREQGRALFFRRFGQLDFSCAQCHDDHPGRRLAGSVIPQAHPTGYPVYRLEWQGLGSLQRRLRNCMTGVRAKPFEPDSAEFTALELYLMQRAAGMPLESPGVRP